MSQHRRTHQQDKLAKLYDAEILPVWAQHFGKMMLRGLTVPPKAMVLDVGCGTGYPALEILRKMDDQGRIIAIDPSSPMLDEARVKAGALSGKRIFFRSESALPKLSFTDDVYDLVVCNAGLQEFDDPESAIRDFARVTKPGGRVIVTLPLAGTYQQFFDLFREVLIKLDRSDAIDRLDAYLTRYPAVEQAKAWAYPSGEGVGVALAGEGRVYPRRIIDWHEMVNDTIAGIPVSLANCTLCGSAILYDGRVDGRVFRFGTSGLLYRSNKLMFDYKTRSLWGQFSGEPAWGPLVGAAIRLEPLPTVHTTYGEWVTAHPETLVLDINTGHIRDYSPGAAYAEYFGSAALMFPVPDAMGPAGPKAIVVAVRIGREVTGYPITDLAERGYIEDTVGDRSVIVVATADGRGGRVYERDRRFAGYDPRAGALVDAAGATWTVAEDALLGPGGRRLARLPGHNAFWFALANHAPVARLWTPE